MRKTVTLTILWTYYIADLVKNLSELIIVCNGKLSDEGRAAFAQFTPNIIVRENKGPGCLGVQDRARPLWLDEARRI